MPAQIAQEHALPAPNHSAIWLIQAETFKMPPSAITHRLSMTQYLVDLERELPVISGKNTEAIPKQRWNKVCVTLG